MKKLFFSILTLFLLSASADTVKISAVWNRKNSARPNQARAVGFFRDAKQIILVLQINGLDKFIASGGSAAIYWNADGDKTTGRFAGKSGFDFQLNFRPKLEKYDLIHWDGNTRNDLANNIGKGVSVSGDKLIIALPATLFDSVKIADKSVLQVGLFANKKRTDSFSFELPAPAAGAPVLCTYTPEKTISAVLKNPPAGKGIAIPAFYTGNGVVRALGVYRDAQKVIFAVVVPKVEKNASMLIYWNADGDRNTGRFAGRQGVDVQFNAFLFEQRIKVLVYPPDQGNKHKKTLTVYDDDFLIESKGEVFFVAFKNETMEQVKLAQKSSMEVVYVQGNQRERIRIDYDFKAPGIGYLPEKLDFVRFGSLRQVRAKKALGIPLKNTTPGVSVWDCQAERFQESEAAPGFAPPVAAFQMQAARGEGENLFFAVERKQPFSSLSLVPGEFVHSSGKTLPGSAVSLKYADFVINDRNDRFTDVLLPEFPGRKVKRQFAVLSVKVPQDAVPGVYKGSVAMTMDGKKLSVIPVELEVFNFNLPEKSAFATAFAIKQSHITKKFRDPKVAKTVFRSMHDQAARMRYGVRLLSVEPKITLTNGKLNIDWSNYDKVKKEFNRRFGISQFTPFQLGSHDRFIRWNGILKKQYKDTNDPEFKSVWEQFVREAVQHHREQKFVDNTLFIIWDEPYSSWNDIIYAAGVIRKYGPEIPIGIFIDKFKPELDKYIDIWLVSAGAIAKMRTAPGMEKKRVWLYNSCGVRDFRLPASDLRGYYLLAWKYNIAGYLYSEINCIEHCKFKDGYFYNTYPTHMWMYVSEDGKKIYDSWRQLLVADGLDDYDYLKLYSEHLKKQGKELPKWLVGKFPVFNTADGSAVFAIDTVKEWNDLRRRIAAELGK